MNYEGFEDVVYLNFNCYYVSLRWYVAGRSIGFSPNYPIYDTENGLLFQDFRLLRQSLSLLPRNDIFIFEFIFHIDQVRVTTRTIADKKEQGEKITMLTAYDYTFARLLDEAQIDMLLVGDSLSNVIQGNDTTLPVTLDEMIYHTKAVVKGAKSYSMVVCDLPFMTYQTSEKDGFRNAGRVMKETGAGAVKLEGGERVCGTVKLMTDNGIPVCGHLGLTPQSINQFGTYRTRGTTPDEADKIKQDALALQDAGVFAIVLEKIPAALATELTKMLKVATIGIGAGNGCDGQVLVLHDMLGLNEEFHPRFVRKYLKLAEDVRGAFTKYSDNVRSGNFPTKEESY